MLAKAQHYARPTVRHPASLQLWQPEAGFVFTGGSREKQSHKAETGFHRRKRREQSRQPVWVHLSKYLR